MATFSITPDMSAETLLGAEGWAFGSQVCIGTRPAFVPNPSSASTNTASFVRGASWDAPVLKESNDRLPVCRYRMRKAAVMKAVPMWVMIR